MIYKERDDLNKLLEITQILMGFITHPLLFTKINNKTYSNKISLQEPGVSTIVAFSSFLYLNIVNGCCTNTSPCIRCERNMWWWVKKKCFHILSSPTNTLTVSISFFYQMWLLLIYNKIKWIVFFLLFFVSHRFVISIFFIKILYF